MAVISAYNDIINRIGGGYWASQPIYGFNSGAGVTLGGNGRQMIRNAFSLALPNSLPTGVSAYIPTGLYVQSSTEGFEFMVAKIVDLGSVNIGTNTFTDGSSMPTITEAGVSRVTCGPIWIEVTTVLNASPGNMTVTYVDQDGNTPETTSAQALGASAGVGASGWVVLNSPDTGATDITAVSVTGGSTPSGVVKFWGIIPIAYLPTSTTANVGSFENIITAGFNCLRLGAGDQIGVFTLDANTRGTVGTIFFLGDS